MSIQIARKQFTVGEYYRMAQAGILSEDDRVELIEGEIIKMSPIGSLHSACVKRLNKLLNKLISPTVLISIQDPIRLSDYSEPEPDIALLKHRKDFYAQHHPKPADVLLVIEVADTSLDYDRNIKLPLYARAGIPEVWLVDLTGEVVEIFAKPMKGAYQTIQTLGRGEVANAQKITGLTIDVNAILG